MDKTSASVIQLHQDNRDAHALSQRLAQEVWTLFIPFQERVLALSNPSAAVSSSI